MKRLLKKIREWFRKLFHRNKDKEPITIPTEPKPSGPVPPSEPVSVPNPKPVEEESTPKPEVPIKQWNKPSLHVIKAFMESLDKTEERGFDAIDDAIEQASGGVFISTSELVESFITDCLNHSGPTIKERKQFLYDYCGIDMDNEDTGSASGYDAWGEKIKSAQSIIDETGYSTKDFNYEDKVNTVEAVDLSGMATNKSVSYSTRKSLSSVTRDGITFYWDEAAWEEQGLDKDICKQVTGAVINVYSKLAFDLIKESYGLSLTDENSTLQMLDDGTVGLQIYLSTKSESAIASINSSRYISPINPFITTRTYELLKINMNYYANGIKDMDGIPSGTGATYLDRTIVHELVHAVMAANINSHAYLPVFIKEGLSELIHGIDDSRPSSILTLVNTDYWTTVTTKDENGNDVKTTEGLEYLLRKVFNLEVTNYSYSTYTYAGGYILLRYLMKQSSEIETEKE